MLKSIWKNTLYFIRHIHTSYWLFKYYLGFIRSRRQNRASIQASRWFVALESNRVTQSDCEKFIRWLQADIENTAQYCQTKELWDMYAIYTAKPEIRLACKKACQRLQ